MMRDIKKIQKFMLRVMQNLLVQIQKNIKIYLISLKMNLINNTLKVPIAVEVDFGMKFIHNLGMMHCDLKLENIMINNVFNVKIINFCLAHFSDFSTNRKSL